MHRLNRVERWLYNGLHSLDFAFWYSKRPLWDIGMILLCAGALASSVIGLCLGVKRLWRDVARLVSGPPRRPPIGARNPREIEREGTNMRGSLRDAFPADAREPPLRLTFTVALIV